MLKKYGQVCSLLLILWANSVPAAELTGTLKKIADSGIVTLGERESSIPFSYYDQNGKPVGYSIDLCLRVVESIKKTLNRPDLTVKMVAVSSQSRIPYVVNGTVDLECGSTTNSQERQKQVAFSVTTYVTSVRMAIKANAGIQSLQDLNGKSVVTTTGTTSDRYLKQSEKSHLLDIRNLHGKDHIESFQMLERNQAAAFVMDEVLLASLIANAKRPTDFAIVGPVMSIEPYALMLRKDDPDFRALVDKTLTGLMESGEINKIYQKWFLQPIPPNGVNLNLPMSKKLKDAFRNPSSEGLAS